MRSSDQEGLVSASPAIRRDTLVWQPYACRQLAGLPEHVDRHAAAGVPIAPDAQKFRMKQCRKLYADGDRAVLMEAADVAKAAEIKFERFRLDQPSSGHVVDHEMGKIGLARDWTERGKFGRGEAGDVVRVGMGVRDPVQLCGRRRGWGAARLAEVTKRLGHFVHSHRAIGGALPRGGGTSTGAFAF